MKSFKTEAASMSDNFGVAPDAMFRTIAELSIDAIALYDTSGRYLYLNPPHRHLFGGLDMSLQERVARFAHPDDVERLLVASREILRGSGTRLEYRLILGSGEVRHVQTQFSIVTDADGKATNIITVTRDVTREHSAEVQLQEREQQLNTLKSIFDIGTWDWDVRNSKLDWSAEMRRIYGIAEHAPLTIDIILSLIHPDDRERVDKLARNGSDFGGRQRASHRIVRPDGAIRNIEANWTTSRDAAGRPTRLIGVSQDVTDRKLTEEQARMSEERLRVMVEYAREYAIFLLDPAGLITSWNQGAERVMGYAAEEIVGKHYSCFFTPEDEGRAHPSKQLEKATLHRHFEGDGWRLRKNGSRFWAHIIVTPFFNEAGSPQGYSVVMHDITERRRAKEDLRSYAQRLRATSRRLVDLQEAERHKLATELHDRIGQNLTVLGLNLKLIANELPSGETPDQIGRIDDSTALLRKTVDAMRNVMAELRPQALDDYGLLAALRLLADGYARRTGIATVVTGAEHSVPVPKSVDLAMFRIVQESLHNAAKHSRANRVDIRLKEKDGHLELDMRDNGVGFDLNRAESPAAEPGWGLSIMRERAEAVGASFTVESSPGKGVRLVVDYRI